jgi:hypothetical protein
MVLSHGREDVPQPSLPEAVRGGLLLGTRL